MNSALITLLGALAVTGGDVTTQADADVERELRALTSIPDAQATITFAPSAGRGYALDAASFLLDGRPLDVPPIDTLRAAPGAQQVFHGTVSSGKHELVIRLLYAGDFGFLSYMTGYKFKLQQKVSFETRRGLGIELEVAPETDMAKEWRDRLSVRVRRSETMLARIDTTEPEPLLRSPHLPPMTEAPTVAKADNVSPKLKESATPQRRTRAALTKATKKRKHAVELATAKVPNNAEPAPTPIVTTAERVSSDPVPDPAPAPTSIVTTVEMLSSAPVPDPVPSPAVPPAPAFAVAAVPPPAPARRAVPWSFIAAVSLVVGCGSLGIWLLRRSPKKHRIT